MIPSIETVDIDLEAPWGPGRVRIGWILMETALAGILTDGIPADFRVLPPRRFQARDFAVVFLSEEETDRLNRFRAMKKQAEWMTGRYVVKELVPPWIGAGAAPAAVTVSHHRDGSPFLAAFPDLRISISHAGRYAAAAVCRGPELDIGLDLDTIREGLDPLFMGTAFSDREIRSLGIRPDAREIFRLWTTKEAFLKYIRLGFNENLRQVEILGDRILHHGREVDVTVRTLDLGKDHLMTLVAGPPHVPGQG